MTYMKRTLALILALCLMMLCGCGGGEPDPTTEPTEITTAPTEATTEATEAPTEPTEAPTEATEPKQLRNPLNGTPIDEPFVNRPFAVSINNIQPAMPQWGIAQADILYEFLAEGYATRCLALFSDITNVQKLGSIRSFRIYFVNTARAYDAIIVRAGGSKEADNAIKEFGLDEIDGIQGFAGKAFYRDGDRLNLGYALEHTLFTNGNLILECADQQGYDLTREEGIDYGLNFTEDGTPDGENASNIKITYGLGRKVTTMTYEESSGVYLAKQFNNIWCDATNYDYLRFENILVLYTKTWIQEDGVHLTIPLTGEGDGYFACGGKIIPIRWSHESDTANYVYTLLDGTPLELGVGKTYIAIVPDGTTVDCE
jgi:hypothetical protein